MKYLLPVLLLALPLVAQDTTDPARGLISSDFIGAIEPLGTRVAQTNLTVVYLDNTKDDQFVDVTAIRADVTALIRAVGATAAPEAYAKAVGKGLTDKYPQIAGLTVTLYTAFNTQGTPGYVTTSSRLAPTLTATVKTAVAQRLAAASPPQSRIVR